MSEAILENVFLTLFHSGAVRSVSLNVFEKNGAVQATIEYLTLTGTRGTIFTKRAEPKAYRIDTAYKFLRGLGLVKFSSSLDGWELHQDQLLN